MLFLLIETINKSQEEKQMNDDNRKQYWEGQCNRAHNMYASLNHMRQIALTFGLSLGALLMAQGSGYLWAGLTIVLFQMGWFVWLSSQALNQSLQSRNIDLWLRIGDTTRNFESDYRMRVPTYYDLIFHRLPRKEELKDTEVVEGRDWRDAWFRILAANKRM